MKRKVYLCNLSYEQIHDDIGGVRGTIVFDEPMTYDEFKKICNERYFILLSEEPSLHIDINEDNIIKKVMEMEAKGHDEI